jgi:hypothetical protein
MHIEDCENEGSLPNNQPCSRMPGNAYATVIARSSFLSARKISVRCARGQLYAT